MSIRQRFRRLRCRLFGCGTYQNYPSCERCGAGLYDYEFRHTAWLDFAYRMRAWFWRKVYSLIPGKCAHCNSRLPFRKSNRVRWDVIEFCCVKCEKSYIPF